MAQHIRTVLNAMTVSVTIIASTTTPRISTWNHNKYQNFIHIVFVVFAFLAYSRITTKNKKKSNNYLRLHNGFGTTSTTNTI